MGISVWDLEPSADELLAARIASGWAPKHSELQAGDEVLGHAACIVEPPGIASPKRIYHVTTEAEWAAALAAGAYAADTLATEGFIHCSTRQQVLGVANVRFSGRAGLVLLEIDPAHVQPEIRYENLEGGEPRFPHIYGELCVDAVFAVHPFAPEDDGTFRLPA